MAPPNIVRDKRSYFRNGPQREKVKHGGRLRRDPFLCLTNDPIIKPGCLALLLLILPAPLTESH